MPKWKPIRQCNLIKLVLATRTLVLTSTSRGPSSWTHYRLVWSPAHHEGELLEFRSKCSILWSYDWVSITLVYTQVVTLSTYSFVIACIFGRQCIDNGSKDISLDVYFPLWTVLQILFYMGLLKVAEHMINQYSEDDEDFDLSYLLNRHSK
ncbi:putative Bestrophin-3, partial [Daphnia magna]